MEVLESHSGAETMSTRAPLAGCPPLVFPEAQLGRAMRRRRAGGPGVLTVLDQDVEALLDQQGCVEDDEAEG